MVERRTKVAGSIKNKVVATDMLEERAKIQFDQTELQEFIQGPQLSYYKAIIED